VTSSPLDAESLGRRIEAYLNGNYNLGIRHRRAVVVSVAGVPLVERYYGRVTATTTSEVRSVTKTVVATLIGMALAEGRLHGLDQTLAELLPDYRTNMSAALAAVTLRSILTMTSGLEPDDLGGAQPQQLMGPDWVGNVVRHSRSPDGMGAFAYSSAGSHLLSAILVQATGQSVLSYARSRLFDPLGIVTSPAFEPVIPGTGTVPDRVGREYDAAGFAWPRDPTGIHVGFAGLRLTARDMTALGSLYLYQGRWRGRQLLSRSWVEQATRSHVPTGLGQTPGYGYQWWVTTAGRHSAFAAIGHGGQLIEVVPDLRLVVAVSTTVTKESPAPSEVYLALVQDVVVPALEHQRR
jgi:CubicO group peptidase (beta-lactamase class C family)